jgi:hypothetical protein
LMRRILVGSYERMFESNVQGNVWLLEFSGTKFSQLENDQGLDFCFLTLLDSANMTL